MTTPEIHRAIRALSKEVWDGQLRRIGPLPAIGYTILFMWVDAWEAAWRGNGIHPGKTRWQAMAEFGEELDAQFPKEGGFKRGDYKMYQMSEEMEERCQKEARRIFNDYIAPHGVDIGGGTILMLWQCCWEDAWEKHGGPPYSMWRAMVDFAHEMQRQEAEQKT